MTVTWCYMFHESRSIQTSPSRPQLDWVAHSCSRDQLRIRLLHRIKVYMWEKEGCRFQSLSQKSSGIELRPLNLASCLPAKGDGSWLYSLLLISPCFSSLHIHILLQLFVFCPHIFFKCTPIYWIWLVIMQLSKVLNCDWQLAGWLRPALSRVSQVVDRMVCLLSLISTSHLNTLFSSKNIYYTCVFMKMELAL